MKNEVFISFMSKWLTGNRVYKNAENPVFVIYTVGVSFITAPCTAV